MRMEIQEPLNKYIEGWLQYKESKKYEMYWFVLKAQSFDNDKLIKANLFCFIDQNTHIKEKYVGSYPISPDSSVVTLVKKDSGKALKFDFVIKLNNSKFYFRARDEITRERWIHALCNLVGKGLPPGQMPSFDNSVSVPATNKTKTRKLSNNPLDVIQSSQRKRSQESSGSPHLSRASIFQNYNMGLSLDSATLQSMRKMSQGSRGGDTKYKGYGKKPSSLSSEPSLTSLISEPFFMTPQADLERIRYYCGRKSRYESEMILNKQTTGTFLLRDSESSPGSFTLSFKDSDKVKHIMFSPTANRRYQFQDQEVKKDFGSIEEAVNFYMQAKQTPLFRPQPYIELSRVSIESDESKEGYLLTSEINSFPPRNSSNGSLTYDCVSPTTKEKMSSSQFDIDGLNGYREEALPPTPDSGSAFSYSPRSSLPPSYEETTTSSFFVGGNFGRSMTLPSQGVYSFPKTSTYNTNNVLPPVPHVSVERVDSASQRPLLQKQKNIEKHDDNIYLESEENGGFSTNLSEVNTTNEMYLEVDDIQEPSSLSSAPALPKRSYMNKLSQKLSGGSTTGSAYSSGTESDNNNESSYLECNDVVQEMNSNEESYLEIGDSNEPTLPVAPALPKRSYMNKLSQKLSGGSKSATINSNKTQNNVSNGNNKYVQPDDVFSNTADYPYLKVKGDRDEYHQSSTNDDAYLDMSTYIEKTEIQVISETQNSTQSLKKKLSLGQTKRAETLPARFDSDEDSSYLPMYGSSDDLYHGHPPEPLREEAEENDNQYVNSMAIELAKAGLNEPAPPLPPRMVKPKKVR